MFKKLLVSAAVVATLAGCGKQDLCPSSTRVELQEATVVGVDSTSKKVIVLPVDMNFKDVAGDKLKSVLLDSIESQVYATGTEIVDRKLASKLKKEIKLAEQSGHYNVSGVPVAQFAVITEITSSELSKDFRESYVTEMKDLISGKKKKVRIPAKCSFEVEVKANAKVVTLPEMKVLERFTIQGDESLTSETNNSSCPINKASYTSLASKAASEAVAYSNSIKKMFASSGRVLELRQCEAGSMVKISMGKNKKIVPKMAIDFLSQEVVDNGDGTTEVETRDYAEGTVVNNKHAVSEKYSWVMIDEDDALKVQKGDKVKVNAEVQCSWTDPECLIQETAKKF